jgi:hypothetical protein
MSSAHNADRMAARRLEIDAEYNKMLAEIEAQYNQRKIKLEETQSRMGMTERLISQAIPTGIVTADVLLSFLAQNTEQEYATTSDAKVDSRAKAQAARNNLDAFKEAEDREMKHQVDMTGQAAKMMESAKQNVPDTLVQGGGITPNVHVSVPSDQPVRQSDPVIRCRKCNNPLIPGGKFCQECSEPVSRKENKCSCGASIESGWEYCPFCAKKVN